MMTDPISDMLTRIRNAGMAKQRTVLMPRSNMKFAVAKIMQGEGYLAGVEAYEDGNKPMMRLTLKYDEAGSPAIASITRVSKPGQRVYVKSSDLHGVRSGLGFAIVSTPNGLMTTQEAKKRHLGGELICEVY
ncbi:30S ribosomal protein S8 [Candidatus Uhrbacteria bacterium]|nr:30S ribosomal protein S8 [Candidatus Uhrbacteria bacterium]